MEVKINLLNLEEAKNALAKLENKINSKECVSDIMELIHNSSGATFDEINEAFRTLKRVEVSLGKLIDATQIVVNNTKVGAMNTDEGISKVFQDTYSNYNTGVFSGNKNSVTFPSNLK